VTEIADGWYGFRLIQADQAQDVPGLDELARYVDRGMVPRAARYLVAYRRLDAPYPDAVIAVQLHPRTAEDWRRGDTAAAHEVAEALEHGYRTLMARERGEEV